MQKETANFLIEKNDYYLKLLEPVYCGKDSEIFSTLQFLIYSNCLSDFQNEITDVLWQISKDDFVHIKKIGEIITFLGGNTKNKKLEIKINFSKNIKIILKSILSIKENSIINYKILRNKIPQKAINSVINNIILDEQMHCEMLKDLINKFNN